jgi:L-alanine-DL-glutamate epimerase-like enolase superfamily enzyme
MKLTYHRFELPFQYPFTTARGTKTHQPTLIVELEHFGLKGYGEAPAIAYYDVTIEKMVAALESKKKNIEQYAIQDPERFWHFLHHLLPGEHFLICALDMAAWDLYGKMRNQPLYRLWKLEPHPGIVTDYTIGMDSIEIMLQKLKEHPWPVYKVKMGWQNDIETIKALRQETDKPIRVDVNSGWSLPEAIEKIKILAGFNIELVEEPLQRFAYEDMKILREQSPLPLFADESCVLEPDVNACIPCFHGINIKLTKCGGITPALRMIKQARNSGLKIMAGCMNESTIGSAALGHLQPLLDYVDMDGPLLLKEDLATGLTYNNGKVTVSEQPGLGIQVLF